MHKNRGSGYYCFCTNFYRIDTTIFFRAHENPRGDFNFNKNYGIFVLENVPSGTHIKTAKNSGSGHHLASGTAPKAPEHGKNLGATMLAPSPSHAERINNTRSTLSATPTTITAYSGHKSYAAAVGNVSVISQADRSQKKSFAQVHRAPQEPMDHKLVSKEPLIHHVVDGIPPAPSIKNIQRQTTTPQAAPTVSSVLPVTSSIALHTRNTTHVTPSVIQTVAPIVVQPFAPETVAISSFTIPILRPSQFAIHVFCAHTDPLAHDMTQ
ncbi:Hypothetical predicted protein [Olea europaea subsp. europaea]|uniref:Uncharacterized protein n=1 Tax=Olea europaea subsp. europaea TaxID=158383 RepID=A0A8S0QDM2_OLEEU|nr:Hypothetical predicted protein [Olea europaea subsp. europaea]